MVVSSQPTTVPTVVHVRNNDQSAMIFAIVVTFILFFCGCWWSFACTIPAIVLGGMVSGSEVPDYAFSMIPNPDSCWNKKNRPMVLSILSYTACKEKSVELYIVTAFACTTIII